MSAITIQSLADLGYTVDVSQADSYQLPATSAMAVDALERSTSGTTLCGVRCEWSTGTVGWYA